MSVYYIVLSVIVALAAINFGTLYWVVSLQRHLRQALEHKAATPKTPVVVTEAETEDLRKKAKDDIAAVMAKVSEAFGQQLNTTAKKLNAQIEELGDKVVQDELTKYQNALDELRQASIDQLSQVQTSVDQRRTQLENDLETEVGAEKKQLLAHFESRVGDILSAYLVDVLGNEVDLGAQSHYLLKMLESNKAELTKAILREP